MQTQVIHIKLSGDLKNGKSGYGLQGGGDNGSKDVAVSLPSADDDQQSLESAVKQAAHILTTTSRPIAFPTETVYGLGANALNSESVSSIFKAKGRPSDNPLIVHISDLDMAKQLLPLTSQQTIPQQYLPLIQAFWPGPLTILLPKGPNVPDTVTAGHPSVAVRMPNHPVALALIRQCGFPIAAPSANTSGRPSPTRASHVYDDLEGVIPLILDGGECKSGVESTVLDGLSVPPAILRPGGVTREMIQQFPGFENVRVFSKDYVDKAMEMAPVTPGMKYRHYTPNVEVILFEPSSPSSTSSTSSTSSSSSSPSLSTETMIYRLSQMAQEILLQHPPNSKIGLLRTSKTELHKDLKDRTITFYLGDATDPGSVAFNLFDGLRTLEASNVVCIIVEGISESNEGLAVMNRLRKASSQVITLKPE